MKINYLEIHNFRGIQHLRIDFQESINILVGVNGSGKTSILDGISFLFALWLKEIEEKKPKQKKIAKQDIKNNTGQTTLRIEISYDNENLSWIYLRDRGLQYGLFKANRSKFKSFTDAMKTLLESDEKANIPIVVYYPVNRAIDIPLRIKTKHTFDRFSAFENSLSGIKTDFRTFFEWYRNREDLENEKRLFPEFPDIESNLDTQLESVRKAISSMLPGFTGLRVKRSPLKMIVKKGTEELQIDQLSDGEKCLLALVGDLARRLAIANPSLENPLEGKGIVLIDEIELHLHPAWQRRIIPSLTKTFPNCQFVVTTHSPQVISHVDQKNIFILKQKGADVVLSQPEESYGLDSNRILEDILDVPERPEEIKNKITTLFKEIDDKNLDRARQNLEEIRSDIGDDPELIKADVLIRRMEILGK